MIKKTQKEKDVVDATIAELERKTKNAEDNIARYDAIRDELIEQIKTLKKLCYESGEV